MSVGAACLFFGVAVGTGCIDGSGGVAQPSNGDSVQHIAESAGTGGDDHEHGEPDAATTPVEMGATPGPVYPASLDPADFVEGQVFVDGDPLGLLDLVASLQAAGFTVRNQGAGLAACGGNLRSTGLRIERADGRYFEFIAWTYPSLEEVEQHWARKSEGLEPLAGSSCAASGVATLMPAAQQAANIVAGPWRFTLPGPSPEIEAEFVELMRREHQRAVVSP